MIFTSNVNLLKTILGLLQRELGEKVEFVTELTNSTTLPMKKKNLCHIYFGNIEDDNLENERSISLKLDAYLKRNEENAYSIVSEIIEVLTNYGLVIKSIAKFNATVKNEYKLVPCEIKISEPIKKREYHISAEGESIFDAAKLENISPDYLTCLSGAESLLQTGERVKIYDI